MGAGEEEKGEQEEGGPALCPGSLSLGSLSPFGDCFPGSLEPEEDGMFLSLPRGKAFFFLHKNVKLHNPIGNLDRLQLVAWVLLLGTAGRGERWYGRRRRRGGRPVEQDQGRETPQGESKAQQTFPQHIGNLGNEPQTPRL